MGRRGVAAALGLLGIGTAIGLLLLRPHAGPEAGGGGPDATPASPPRPAASPEPAGAAGLAPAAPAPANAAPAAAALGRVRVEVRGLGASTTTAGEAVLYDLLVSQASRPHGDVLDAARWTAAGPVVLRGGPGEASVVVAPEGRPARTTVVRLEADREVVVEYGPFDGARLEGTVVDRDGVPVGGLAIVLGGVDRRGAFFTSAESDLAVALGGPGVPTAWTRVRTGPDGRFTAWVEPNVEVRATADSDAWVLFDEAAWRDARSVVPESGATVRWTATPARSLVAAVVDAKTRRPIPDATLDVRMDPGFSATFSARDGPRFSWPDRAAPGRGDSVSVAARAPGYVSEKRSLRYEEGASTVRAEFALLALASIAETVTIAVDVVDDRGRPIDLPWNVTLGAPTDPGPPLLRPTPRRTAPGRVEFDAPAADWGVTIDLEPRFVDLYSWTGVAHAATRGERGIQAVLPRSGVLVVEWRASGDQPARPGAGVWIRKPGFDWWVGLGDHDLPLRVRLPPMTLPLRVERRDSGTRVGSATIVADTETFVDVATFEEEKPPGR